MRKFVYIPMAERKASQPETKESKPKNQLFTKETGTMEAYKQAPNLKPCPACDGMIFIEKTSGGYACPSCDPRVALADTKQIVHTSHKTSGITRAYGYPCGRCKHGVKSYVKVAGGWMCENCGMVFPYIGLPEERMTEKEKKCVYDMPVNRLSLMSSCDKVELIAGHGSGCVQAGGRVWNRLSFVERCPHKTDNFQKTI